MFIQMESISTKKGGPKCAIVRDQSCHCVQCDYCDQKELPVGKYIAMAGVAMVLLSAGLAAVVWAATNGLIL
jgi:hypothetical protein